MQLGSLLAGILMAVCYAVHGTPAISTLLLAYGGLYNGFSRRELRLWGDGGLYGD